MRIVIVFIVLLSSSFSHLHRHLHVIVNVINIVVKIVIIIIIGHLHRHFLLCHRHRRHQHHLCHQITHLHRFQNRHLFAVFISTFINNRLVMLRSSFVGVGVREEHKVHKISAKGQIIHTKKGHPFLPIIS